MMNAIRIPLVDRLENSTAGRIQSGNNTKTLDLRTQDGLREGLRQAGFEPVRSTAETTGGESIVDRHRVYDAWTVFLRPGQRETVIINNVTPLDVFPENSALIARVLPPTTIAVRYDTSGVDYVFMSNPKRAGDYSVDKLVLETEQNARLLSQSGVTQGYALPNLAIGTSVVLAGVYSAVRIGSYLAGTEPGNDGINWRSVAIGVPLLLGVQAGLLKLADWPTDMMAARKAARNFKNPENYLFGPAAAKQINFEVVRRSQ